MTDSQHYMTAAGKAKLAALEGGHHLKSYLDSANVWTISVGVTGNYKGQPIGPNTVITQEQSNALFTLTLGRFENGVRKLLKREIDQRHYEMVVMFAYNIGLGAFGKSSALKLINAGADWTKVYASMRQWNKITVNGKLKVSNGLINRRNKEIAWASGKNQTPLRDKVAIGVGTVGGAGAVVEQVAPEDTVDTLINSVGMFGMSGSTVLATIGSVIVIGAIGYLIWRKVGK